MGTRKVGLECVAMLNLAYKGRRQLCCLQMGQRDRAENAQKSFLLSNYQKIEMRWQKLDQCTQ